MLKLIHERVTLKSDPRLLEIINIYKEPINNQITPKKGYKLLLPIQYSTFQIQSSIN